MSDSVEKFKEERLKLNELILKRDNLELKRFFNLDHNVYKDGVLNQKTKEMLGLVASLVLRCDDCISYHILQAKENEVSHEELDEIMSIGLVVGGSITIPHIRRAYKLWEEINQ